MKKLVFGFFILILVFSFVNSIDLTPEILNSVGCEGLIQFGPKIIGTGIPSKVPYSNEIINVYINSSIFGNIVLEEKIITEVSCSENSEKTYDIYIKNYETIFDLMNSEDKVSEFKIKLENKEIEIKGATIGKKLKWFFSKIALNFI